MGESRIRVSKGSIGGDGTLVFFSEWARMAPWPSRRGWRAVCAGCGPVWAVGGAELLVEPGGRGGVGQGALFADEDAAIGERDQRRAAVGGVGLASDEAFCLEAIDQFGDVARGDAQLGAELAHLARALALQRGQQAGSRGRGARPAHLRPDAARVRLAEFANKPGQFLCVNHEWGPISWQLGMPLPLPRLDKRKLDRYIIYRYT